MTVIAAEIVAVLNGEERPARRRDESRILMGELYRSVSTDEGIIRILWGCTSTRLTWTFAEAGETAGKSVRNSS